MKEEYLYDGVYASFDGIQMRLRTTRENGDHIIYIDDQVWEDLKDFAVRCGIEPKPAQDAGKAE